MDYSWLNQILEQEAPEMTDKQKAVIKAAVELFSEKGYAATSTREIAQKAGVAEGTIFKHYPTKKDLILWITNRIISTALFPLLSSGLSGLLSKSYRTREEFLSAFFQNRMEQFQKGLPLFKIVIQEVPFQPEIRAMLMEQIQKMPFAGIAEKMRIGEDTHFSKTDVIQILVTCIMGFFFLHDVLLPELFPENRKQKDVAALVRFMNKGLG